MKGISRLSRRERGRRWEGRNSICVVALSHEVVRAAADCFDVLEQNRLKKGPIYELPKPDLKLWFGFYSNHRRQRRGLLEAIGCDSDCVSAIDQILGTMSWFTIADREIVDKVLSQGIEAAEAKGLNAEIADMLREMASQEWDMSSWFDDVDAKAAIVNPALVYFLQVAMPLFLRHGEWPNTMFWRATRANKPDFKVLDRLIRADRRVRNHPVLLAAIKAASLEIRTEFERVIKTAMIRRPQKIRMSTLKGRLASLPIEAGASFGSRIEGRHMRDLFDKVARSQPEFLRDHDLPPAPETLRRQINRVRKHWALSLPATPAAETLKSVRAQLGLAS